MGNIVVVGSSLYDLMCLTSQFSMQEEHVLDERSVLSSDNKAINQVILASKCGSKVTILTGVGYDVKNNHYSEEVTATKKGKNTIVIKLCGKITEENVEDVIKQANIVLLKLESNINEVVAAVRLAQKYNIPTVFHPTKKQEFPKGILHNIHYITLNETEAFELSRIKVNDQQSALKAAKIIQMMGFMHVIITFHNKGAFVYTVERKATFISGYSVKATDSPEATDAFNGEFIHALSEGMPIIEAVKFANGVAALAVTRK